MIPSMGRVIHVLIGYRSRDGVPIWRPATIVDVEGENLAVNISLVPNDRNDLAIPAAILHGRDNAYDDNRVPQIQVTLLTGGENGKHPGAWREPPRVEAPTTNG